MTAEGVMQVDMAGEWGLRIRSVFMVKEIAEVVYQSEIATDIYSLLLKVTFARDAVPGQFVSLYSADGSRLLPRPISICETVRRFAKIPKRRSLLFLPQTTRGTASIGWLPRRSTNTA